jgi:hypothetical protein
MDLDSLILADSLNADSLALAQLRAQSDLKAAVKYQARDSILFDVQGERILLFGDARMEYETFKLQADRVQIDWATNTVHAQGTPDSLGVLQGTPVFEENGQMYYAQSMSYNFKTRRGKIRYAKTNQQGDYLLGDAIKRNPDNSYFVGDGKFTTCDHDHPHFYFKAKKLKIIPGDKIISGPLIPVILDLPLPIVVPFGYFPFQNKRQSGILFPDSYGEALDRGFFARNLGFYWAASDYWDVAIRGDVFSLGGWRLALQPTYKKRYHYEGRLSAEYSLISFGERTDPDRREQRQFLIQWNHQQKFSPTASLTANVNAGSARFLQTNRFDVASQTNNTLQSSISFNKSFANSPWNLTLSAQHRQDLTQQQTFLALPSLALNRARWFPFKREVATGGRRWYEDIGVTYGLRGENQAQTPDSLFLTREWWDTLRYGLGHNVNVATSFKLFQYITLSPNLRYNEYWYGKTDQQQYIETQTEQGTIGQIQTGTERGFAAARDFAASLNLGTTLYGIRQFKGPSKMAFRHTLNPNLSYTYKPDFSTDNWGYFRTVQTNPEGDTRRYNRFQSGVLGSPTAGENQLLGFTLQNKFEMKYLPRSAGQDSTLTPEELKAAYKRITLLDNLGLALNYNFAADSQRLSTVRLDARSSTVFNLFSFNLNGTLDPYQLTWNTQTRRYQTVDRVVWQDGQLGRLTQASFSIQAAFDSQVLSGKKPAPGTQPNNAANNNPPGTPDPNAPPPGPRHPGYADFQIPWRAAVYYVAQLNNPDIRENRVLSHSLRLNGNLDLTRLWKVTFDTGYDFTNRKVTLTRFTVARDLHCWVMGLSVTPFGRFQSYQFSLNVKAATLRDLRINKQRNWQDQFFE